MKKKNNELIQFWLSFNIFYLSLSFFLSLCINHLSSMSISSPNVVKWNGKATHSYSPITAKNNLNCTMIGKLMHAYLLCIHFKAGLKTYPFHQMCNHDYLRSQVNLNVNVTDKWHWRNAVNHHQSLSSCKIWIFISLHSQRWSVLFFGEWFPESYYIYPKSFHHLISFKYCTSFHIYVFKKDLENIHF